ncbi:hypothetical protein [Lactobacillus selangorensis]|uniref:hypothetical protein n=1 Tax=Lactobacillus selangorensis TaxID=81857 RepID=UPI00070F089A|nr:hypothetical protein [Lactobacillus selangorensis]
MEFSRDEVRELANAAYQHGRADMYYLTAVAVGENVEEAFSQRKKVKSQYKKILKKLGLTEDDK